MQVKVKEIGQRNVMLCWVPGHSGISENGCPNVLENKASVTELMGSETFCDLSRKGTRGGGGDLWMNKLSFSVLLRKLYLTFPVCQE